MLRMVRWERWLTLAAVSLSAFALTVWLGDIALPWGQEARVGTATGAGAVLAALVLTWGTPGRACRLRPRLRCRGRAATGW